MPRRFFYYLAVAAFLAGAVFLRLADPFAVQALRYLGFDAYQRIDPAQAPTADERPVVVIDIDEESLRALGQWPWPRTRLADLARKLAADGAAAIAFDALFSEPDQNSPEEVVKHLPAEQAGLVAGSIKETETNDRQFADALAAVPSVLGISLSRSSTEMPPIKAGFAVAGDDPRPFVTSFTGAIPNIPVIEDAAQGVGSINWIPDRDQIVRRVPLVFRMGDHYVPSLAAEALRVAQGAGSYILKASNANGEEAFGRSTGLNHVRIGAIVVPTDQTGALWLRFRPSDPDTFISAKSVLDGSADPQAIAGRIALIGTSAAGLLDLRATPIDEAVPGVEIHAQVIEHILSGRSLTRPDYAIGVELFTMVALGLLLSTIIPLLPATVGALVGFAAIGGMLLGGFLAFDKGGLLFDPLYAALVLILLTVGAALYTYRETERARAGIRLAFGHYVSPDVVDEIIANPARLELGGELRQLSILFCDVRGFTTISESMNASQLTHFINSLLTPLTDVILAHRGTIDKYMGDAVMAFWNAPLDDPDHARHAIEAAQAMLAAMPGLNETWQREAEAAGRTMHEVRIGIGINTGLCCVGNLGSASRFDYSAIGDEVNVASRLESLTKDYGLGLIVSDATAKQSRRNDLLEIDRVKLRGRSGETALFTMIPQDAPPQWREAQIGFIEAGTSEAARVALDQAIASAPASFTKYYDRKATEMKAQSASAAPLPPPVTAEV